MTSVGEQQEDSDGGGNGDEQEDPEQHVIDSAPHIQPRDVVPNVIVHVVSRDVIEQR